MQLVFLPLSAINTNNISLNLDLCFWSNCFIFIQYKLNDTDYCMCVLGYTSAEHKHTINHCSYTEAACSQRQDHMSKYLYLMMGLAPAAGVTLVQLGVLDREIYTAYVRRRLFI